MISVVILINGNPIMARSAVNSEVVEDGLTLYLVDDGTVLRHDPRDGAVALAIGMLGTIKEQKGEGG